jgi:hypothetical protein
MSNPHLKKKKTTKPHEDGCEILHQLATVRYTYETLVNFMGFYGDFPSTVFNW